MKKGDFVVLTRFTKDGTMEQGVWTICSESQEDNDSNVISLSAPLTISVSLTTTERNVQRFWIPNVRCRLEITDKEYFVIRGIANSHNLSKATFLLYSGVSAVTLTYQELIEKVTDVKYTDYE